MGTPSADSIRANHYNQEYAYQVWGLVAPFLFLLGVIHYGSAALSALFPRETKPVDVEADGRLVRRRASIRRLPLAIMNAYRVLAFRTTFTIGPFSLNLTEVALTITYIVALFVWTFINTTALDGTRFARQYYMNRAANIACGQLPLVVALGTKNNIVGLITGLSHEKINYMHRMTARVVFVLLWVHSGPRLKFLKPGSLHAELVQVGILAISAFSFLILVSLRPVRKAAYELFFFLHFAMVLLFLIGGYIHTKEPGVTYWFWVSFIIWGLDRLIRLVRLVVFNHSYFGFKKGTGTMDANIGLLSPDFVRLRVLRPSHFHWSPGQVAYLIMPGVSTVPFEAHPFTIASVDTADEKPQGDDAPTMEKEVLAETEPYWKELVFIINVHSGFTKKLREVAEKSGKARVFVDGPYGSPPDLKQYDTSVLIAGGSGVTFILPLLLDGIRKVAAGKSNTKRITFIWSIRNRHHISWVSETLGAATKLAPAGLDVSIRIYVTRESVSQQSDNVSVKSGKEIRETEEGRPPSLFEDPAVQVTSGSRPNLEYILQKEADFTQGRMGVTVCGSQSLSAGVKDALGFSIAGPSTIMNGGPSITLHTEAFGYA